VRSFFRAAFFALNADLPWMDGEAPSLQQMAKTWDASSMDALLLLMKTGKARGFKPDGDFALDSKGKMQRKGLARRAPM